MAANPFAPPRTHPERLEVASVALPSFSEMTRRALDILRGQPLLMLGLFALGTASTWAPSLIASENVLATAGIEFLLIAALSPLQTLILLRADPNPPDDRTLGEQLGRYPAVLVATLFYTLSLYVGMALLFVPGLWLMSRFCFMDYDVFRGLSPIEGWKTSYAQTRGRAWGILARLLPGVALGLLGPIITRTTDASFFAVRVLEAGLSGLTVVALSLVVYVLYAFVRETEKASA